MRPISGLQENIVQIGDNCFRAKIQRFVNWETPRTQTYIAQKECRRENDSRRRNRMPSTDSSAATLVAAIDKSLGESHDARRLAAFTLLAATPVVQAHPNHAAYVFGGLVERFQFGVQHVPALIGLLHTPAGEVIERIETTGAAAGWNLAVAMRVSCEADPGLEVRGYAVCEMNALLKRGRIDGFWIKRPRLGLGQGAILVGFEARYASPMRKILDVPAQSAGVLISRFAPGLQAIPFGAVLTHVAATDDGVLAMMGARLLHKDARDRYYAKRASFAAHQAATDDRRWREKVPRSRQGHLAVTTANAKSVERPSERQRGPAADWLERHGANVRFVKEGQ
jgi:hypothetical protein